MSNSEATGEGVFEIDAVTPEWLTAVLREGGSLDGGTVVAMEREPVGTGQVGDTHRVFLTYDDPVAHPLATVVAKMSSPNPESRTAASLHRLYEREVGFYEVIAPRVGIRAPRCFHSQLDVAGNRFALLLEDLAPAHMADQITGMDVGQVAIALSELARLHAPLWSDPLLDELDWLNHGRTQTDAALAFVPMLFDSFLDRYRDRLDDDTLSVIERHRELSGPFMDAAGAPPLTVTHGDYRADNMLFDANAGADPLVVVDWQTVAQGPALLDVAFLLGTGLDADLRRSHEEKLVRDYHDAIVRLGVGGYDWSRCWDDYRRFASYAVLMLVPAAAMVVRTDRGDEMFLAMLGRAATQINDLGTESLLTS